MKKIPKPIVLDYEKQPNEFHCLNCGERRLVHLPAAIDDFVKQAEAFAASHWHCRAEK